PTQRLVGERWTMSLNITSVFSSALAVAPVGLVTDTIRSWVTSHRHGAAAVDIGVEIRPNKGAEGHLTLTATNRGQRLVEMTTENGFWILGQTLLPSTELISRRSEADFPGEL